MERRIQQVAQTKLPILRGRRARGLWDLGLQVAPAQRPGLQATDCKCEIRSLDAKDFTNSVSPYKTCDKRCEALINNPNIEKN